MDQKIKRHTALRKLITLLTPFVLSSCATATTEEPKSTFRYINIAPGPGFSIVLDTSTSRFFPFVEGALDTVPTKLTVCGSESEYLCFYDTGMTFGVPRNGLDAAPSWKINGLSFRVASRLATPSCGSNFIIESSNGMHAVGIFVFNYQLGLQSMMFVKSVRSVSLEEVAGDVYSFGPIYQVDGLGFGGSGICER